MIGYIITELQANQVQEYVNDRGTLGISWTINVKTTELKVGVYAVYDNIKNALTDRGLDWETTFFTLTGVEVSSLEHRNILKSEIKPVVLP